MKKEKRRSCRKGKTNDRGNREEKERPCQEIADSDPLFYEPYPTDGAFFVSKTSR